MTGSNNEFKPLKEKLQEVLKQFDQTDPAAKNLHDILNGLINPICNYRNLNDNVDDDIAIANNAIVKISEKSPVINAALADLRLRPWSVFNSFCNFMGMLLHGLIDSKDTKAVRRQTYGGDYSLSLWGKNSKQHHEALLAQFLTQVGIQVPENLDLSNSEKVNTFSREQFNKEVKNENPWNKS